MDLLSPCDICLSSLAGRIPAGRLDYLPADLALSWLQELTGQDHGYDVSAWEGWLLPRGLIRKPHSPGKQF